MASKNENPYADLTRDGLSSKGTYVRLAKRPRPLQELVLKPSLFRWTEDTVRLHFKLSAFYPEGLARARANRPFEGIGEKLEAWFEESELKPYKHSDTRVGTEFYFDVKAAPGDAEKFKEVLSDKLLEKVFVTVALAGVDLDEVRRAKKAVLRRLVEQFNQVFSSEAGVLKLPKREVGKVTAEHAYLKNAQAA